MYDLKYYGDLPISHSQNFDFVRGVVMKTHVKTPALDLAGLKP